MRGRYGCRIVLAAFPVSAGCASAFAQYGPPPGAYVQYYNEQPGQPLLGARQGWVAGLAQGQSDREYGHSFRPTHDDTFKHVPRCPQGYPRDQFKQE